MPLSCTNILADDSRHQFDGDSLLGRVELEGTHVENKLSGDEKHRSKLGQFMTPANVAAFMASMIEVNAPRRQLRILDPGSGTGMLTAAIVARLSAGPVHSRPRSIHAVVWEIDGLLLPELHRSLSHCKEVARRAGIDMSWEARHENFVLGAVDLIASNALFATGVPEPFDLAILNPPYRKLSANSLERSSLDRLGMGTSNLYAAFVRLSLELLSDGGELVAITPRSFMNGTYFRTFREALLRRLALRRVHVYDARDAAFSADGVLQENVIFHGVRSAQAGPVLVTTSYGPNDAGSTERMVAPTEMVFPDDRHSMIRLVTDENGARITRGMRSLPHRVSDLGISVSTGQVVGFRAKHLLNAQVTPGDAPMILSRHCRDGFVVWPIDDVGIPNGLSVSGVDGDPVLPSGWYVLVNRFSAKEDRRRVVATILDPARLDASHVAFDNKLNVFHRQNAGLPQQLAKGIAVFLNSSVVDAYFRQFSGHTQVNAEDLRTLQFPDSDTLVRLGNAIGDAMPSADEIDALLNAEVPTMADSVQATTVTKRVEDTMALLRSFGVRRGQLNERSALTFLALLALGPTDDWSEATAPLRGVSEMMGWMERHYGRAYAPNTRETIRRSTLHQFMGMGLVALNPDDPNRPINSPNNVYQLHASVPELIRTRSLPAWDDRLSAFKKDLSNRDQLADQERDMELIPVTLSDGTELALTAGGQNVLVKEIIDRFGERFVPGGKVVYVGDAGASGRYVDVTYLAELGIVYDEAGPMPDVLIHDSGRDWLVVVEAVTSHGPVNNLRLNQLNGLFADCSCGIVYVTAFWDRDSMRRYLTEIAWETDVWVASSPTHLIHFDGEKFLGPYDETQNP